MLLAARDYFDYYRSTRLTGRIGHRFEQWDATFAVTASAEEPSSLQTATGYDLFGDEAQPRADPPIPDRSVRHLGLEVALGEEGMPDLLQMAGSRRLEVGPEYGSEGLGGAYEYTRLTTSGSYRISTFFKRRMLPNTLDLRFAGQTAWVELPAIRNALVDGRLSGFAPFGVLKTRDPFPYVGEEAVSFFWEHNFRTVPFEWLGLDGMARRFYSMLVYGGHARTWSEADAALLHRGSGGWHHEVGVGLSGLSQFLRLDLAALLGEPGVGLTLSRAKLF